MFRKVLSSIGIGSARIDFSLPRTKFAAGEVIMGQLKVEGGILDQQINQVYIKLLLRSSYKKDDRIQEVSREFDHEVITAGFEVKKGSRIQPIPVNYALPESIPVSTSSTRYYLITGLDISSAVDPKDSDLIEVLPGRRQAIVMQAIEKELGFRRRQRTGAYNGRFQEFEYQPRSFMLGKLDELEVVYSVEKEGIRLYMQIDKKARGLFGMLTDDWDIDERNVAVMIPYELITTPAEVASHLAGVIEKEYKKIF